MADPRLAALFLLERRGKASGGSRGSRVGVAWGARPAPVSSADGLAMVSGLDAHSSVCVLRNVIFKKQLIVLIYAARGCHQSSSAQPPKEI